MRSSRLVQLSSVICAAGLALSGYGITLMSFNPQSPSSQTETPAASVTVDAQVTGIDSSRGKGARLSLKRFTRRSR